MDYTKKKDEAQSSSSGLDGPGSVGTTSRGVRPETPPYRNLKLLEQMAAGDAGKQNYQDGLSIRLLNLNYTPENNLIGTVYSEVLASPATPATMEKSTRSQIHPPLEIFDFSDEAMTYHNIVQNGFGTSQQATTENSLELCLSEVGLASGIASLQHQEHEIIVVPPSAEIPLQQSQEGNHGIDYSKTPKQKPSRKKHRPKVIREDKPTRTPKPATPKPLTPRRARKTESTSQGKRKYVRKKKDLNSPEKFLNALEETVNLDGVSVNKSVRRSLNFNLDSQERDRCSTSEMLFTLNAESQATTVSSDTKSDVHSVQGQGIEGLENPLGEQFMFYLNGSPNQSRNEGLPEALKKLQADYISKINDLNKVLGPSIGEGENLTKHARKSTCVNVVGDLEGSLEADEVHNVSDNISDVLLKGSKRCHDLVYDAKVSTEINLMHAHTETDRVSDSHDESRIGNCHKKKRTINGKNEGMSAYSTFTCTSTSWKMTPIAQNTSEVFTFTDAKRFMANENLQASESMLVSNQAETTNGRPVPAHSSVSLNTVVEQPKVPGPVKLPGQGNLGHSQPSTPEKLTDNRNYMWYGPEARIKALIRSKELKTNTRGRRKKEQVYLLNPTCSNANRMVKRTPSCTIDSSNQLRSVNTVASPTRNFDRKNLHLEEASVQDSEMEIEIPHKEPIDDIIQMLWYLNINGMYQNFPAVQKNSLVLYARGPGSVVNFEGPLSIIKKRRPRAKVDLDPESDRVWKVLMGKETGDGETGIDKEKWWEEERRVYRGRVDSFISRMHSIQGDRRFSRWKGSVLDSIIGVFLTQNVSDHLSSSAYMSLAARFPAKSIGGNQSQNAEKESSPVAFEDAIGEHGKLSEQSSGAPSSAQIHESEQVDLKEMANCKETIESKTESGVFDYSRGNGLECHDRELQIGHVSLEIGSATTAVNSTSYMNGVEGLDGRPLEDVASSPNSAISSQNSSEYIVQESDQSKGNSIFNNGDDLLSSGIGNTGTNSFMELLKLASNGGLQEIDTRHKGSAPMENNGGIDQLTDTSIDQRPSLPDQFSYLGIRQRGISVEHLNTRTAATTATFHQRGTEVTLQVETTQREVKSQLENCIEFNNQKNTFEVTALVDSHLRNQPNISQKIPAGVSNNEVKANKVKAKAEEKPTRHWDSLRSQAFCNGAKKERSSDTMDSMDYEAFRNADVNVISHTIRERGMNNLLAARMKGLLNRLVEDHGSTDMEWLRDVPPDQVKDYLLSVRGLGLKSVECVRLLTLHHLAFPVDTNVGRIAVRLGWVPLQNLPDSLQLHLLELYPVMEHIQKYLWPRLCKLDQQTLYELHYQMITFGKVFCTKSKPNCNACPMKGECKHFASAFANSRLLTGPEEKSPASSATSIALEGGHTPFSRRMPLEGGHTPVFRTITLPQLEESTQSHDQAAPRNCEPIIEEPASPEPEYDRTIESAIEDAFYDDPDEIPAINLNMEVFTQNLKSYMQQNMDLQDGDISNALVAVTSESASIPMPKLKNVSRLRTEHQVYELPDSHPLLEGMGDREPDDPCPYLLAIWTAGETAYSSEPPRVFCNSQDTTKLCEDNSCFSCNTIREAQAKTVRGTLLIPCRTAMRGSFPLNGTYFQVNEVFADHYSSRNPINVPRSWIWNLPRRTVYFGTSIPTIFKGLATKEIQHCFWRGFVCVRGFDRTTRAPKPLYARLHLPASKATKDKMAAKAAKESGHMQAATGNELTNVHGMSPTFLNSPKVSPADPSQLEF